MIAESPSVKGKFEQFVSNHLVDVVLVLAIVAYVGRAIATIGLSNKAIIEILADGAITFVFAYAVALILRNKGILRGLQDNRFLDTFRGYGEQFCKITENIEFLQDFCDNKNEQNMRSVIVNVLANYGMSYENYLKVAAQDKPLTDLQRQAISSVRKIKIYKLTVRDLTSENNTKKQFELGKDIKDYKNSNNLLSISLAVVSLLFGTFTLSVGQFDVWKVVWACFQIAYFLIKGTIAYVSAYMFVIEDYRNRIIRKTNLLNEFENITKKSLMEATKGE